VSSGSFQNALGPTTTLVATYYPSGTQEIPLLVKGTLDMAFIGPDPAITAANQTGWKGITILAGVASGGAVFVVRNNSGITPGDNKTLGGKTFGAPGLGNTQDIALRYYLMSNGYCLGGSGCVNIVDASNSNLVTMFAQGRIDGAWVPEPYGEILMQQFGGKLFLDERSLWPGGNFSTAELVVRTQFLDQHPDVVRDIVSADVNETIWINNHLSQAETDLNDTLVAKTGQGYSQSVLNGAFARLAFTFDPLESSVLVQAEHAYALGDLPAYDPESIAGIYNLSILNSVLAAEGLPSIQ